MPLHDNRVVLLLDRFMDAIRRLREYWFEVVVLPRV